ncbi:MAG TPA: hypothetical protein VMS65_09930 [Polyangiaceae bacterium]|nr:hypothetical protein [Polyangiaceae bacterium]
MKRLFFTLFFVSSVIGCSGSQPGPGADENSLKTEAAFCTAWAKAACNDDVVAACNAMSETDCIDSQQQACRAIVPTGYDSKYAEDCVEAVRDAYEDAELTAEELETLLRLGGACKVLIDGGQQEGDECASTIDCDGVSGFECVIKAGQTLGMCEIPVPAGGGDSCLEPEVVCEDGFYCNGSDCLRRKTLDTVCDSDAMCAAELRCDIPTGGSDGTCVERLGNGDPCTIDADCASGVCLGSTETDKICVSSVILTVRDPLCRDLR